MPTDTLGPVGSLPRDGMHVNRSSGDPKWATRARAAVQPHGGCDIQANTGRCLPGTQVGERPFMQREEYVQSLVYSTSFQVFGTFGAVSCCLAGESSAPSLASAPTLPGPALGP